MGRLGEKATRKCLVLIPRVQRVYMHILSYETTSFQEKHGDTNEKAAKGVKACIQHLEKEEESHSSFQDERTKRWAYKRWPAENKTKMEKEG
jgi:hypothetical protein